eukprot:71176_1
MAIERVLKSMDVENYEPRVVNQLLEFMCRYTDQILVDAQDYAEHAGKPMCLNDLKLANSGTFQHEFVQPPDRLTLMTLSRRLNQVPLDIVPTKPGVLLPPSEEDSQMKWNFQLVSGEGDNEEKALVGERQQLDTTLSKHGLSPVHKTVDSADDMSDESDDAALSQDTLPAHFPGIPSLPSPPPSTQVT